MNQQSNHKTLIAKAGELIKHHTVHNQVETTIPYCALGMLNPDGGPTVSAITVSKAQGIEWMTFCTGLASNKAKRLETNNRASVCFCTDQYNISLTGTLEIITDPAIKQEMWYPPLSQHFTGPDDEQYCVLKFTTTHYNLLIDWQEVRGSL